MQTLLAASARVAALLIARGDTLAVAESSAGGLISAALLAVPGASGYFRGGDIIYTAQARAAFGITAEAMHDMRASTEPYAHLLAETASARLGTVWAIAETGATGPAGNRYGDPAGHACIAVAGPVTRSLTIETGHGDRVANMREFAAAALMLLEEALQA
jgi:nicotinamide-nucleotide amidase